MCFPPFSSIKLLSGWFLRHLQRHIVHIDDVALAHVVALEKNAAKGRYILCNGDTLSMLEIADVIRKK
ncbi:unnamed protein product [Closterium sp. NIES-65]|nr:unnamed protein product [Closterium sp. NIES-65]